MTDSMRAWIRASAVVAALAGGCADPDLESDLITAGPPTVSVVMVTGEAGTEATYCNPRMGDHTPDACVAGETVEPVADVRPLQWSARVVFKELLDPSIEDITGSEGSIKDAHPFTVTCGGAELAYDGFYDPSGNHETSPPGPALVIHGEANPAVAAGTACHIAIDAGAVRDKQGQAAPTDVAFDFTIAPLHVQSSMPADAATGVDPAVTVEVVLNSKLDALSLAGRVTLRAGGSAVPAAISVSLNDPAMILIDPDADLARGTAYTITVTPGVRDTLGGPLADPHAFTFTTAP